MEFEASLTSKKDDWETPKELYEELNREFHFTLDAASSDQNHKAEKYYTQLDDGLAQNWAGEVVWCNPPYGRLETARWVAKAYHECEEHGATVVMLLASRTDTRWFHDYIYGKQEIRFVKGRLRFEQNGEPSKQCATFASMIVIFRPRR